MGGGGVTVFVFFNVRVAQIYQKVMSKLKILCSAKVVLSNAHTEEPQTLDTTVFS